MVVLQFLLGVVNSSEVIAGIMAVGELLVQEREVHKLVTEAA